MNNDPHTTGLDERLADPLRALQGGEAIGHVGLDVPVEVLLATGRPFGHLPWHGDEGADTAWADRWLESSFPQWCRVILARWHAGAFDGLRDVVFSRGDDASQRLFYYVRELQRRGQLRGPAARIFDPALVPRESSLAHTAQSVEQLLRELGGDPASLEAGIARADALRARLARLQQARVADGPWHERLARAALWNNPADWIAGIAAPAAAPRPRVLLAGSMPLEGFLHRAVEEGGGSVVGETHGARLDRLGDDTEAADAETPEADPARRIALRLVRRGVGPRMFRDAAAALVRRARSVRAQIVILWLAREDEALAWQLPAQRAALDAAGIPALALPAADWRGADGAAERIRSFCAEQLR